MSADDSILNATDDTNGAGGGGDGGAPGSDQAQGGQPAATDTGAQDKPQDKQAGGDADDGILGDKPGEDKKDDDKDADGDKKDGDDKPAEITAESYGDFTTPDGMTVNQEILGEFKTVAAELKLPKEAAQKLVDLQVKNVQAQAQQWKDVRKGWVDDLKSDKDYGGEKFDGTIHKANMALRQFDPEGGFLKALKGTFDNHPETVKFLARVHDALGEDAVHQARAAGKGKDEPLSHRLYRGVDMGHGVPRIE